MWVTGRKDDIFKRGGEKVSAVHIQQAIVATGTVVDAVVLALDDELLGKVPVAFVVPVDPGVVHRARADEGAQEAAAAGLASGPRRGAR